MNQQQKDEMQIQANGRAFAGDILNQAVSTSQNVQDLNNKLHVLNCMAVHVIASNLFNRIKSTKAEKTQLLEETDKLIRDELELLFEHESEMETINPDKKAE